MASTTTNLGLTKPAYTDDADVAVINANSDIIDSAYGSLSDQMATYKKIYTATKDVTTSANGNFSVGDLSSQSHIILSITCNSPSDVAIIPTKYSASNPGYLGGHAMSSLAAHSAIANANLNVTYAYIEL